MSDIFIHPTANVSDQADVSDGCRIWINSQIREGARIGRNCIISKDTYIDFDVSIGDRCKIQNGVSVYHGVTVEDDVFLGPNCTLTNDKVPRAFNDDWKTTETLIRKGASVGANATIVCGVTLGEYCMVGAGSVVTKDVAPYSLVIGNPARHICFVDKDGNRIEEAESNAE